MKHLGWKVAFFVSWLIAGPLYYFFAFAIFQTMGEEDVGALIGGVISYALLVPVILMAGLQVALGFLAFRK